MEKYIYELHVSFKSGEQLIYGNEDASLKIYENYVSDININPQLIGDLSEKKCFSIITIDNTNAPSSTNFLTFKTFGENIIYLLQNEDFITNIIIKDTYGNVYYNLLEDDIFGVEFGSNNSLNNTNVLCYKMQIYRKKDE